MKKVTVTYYTLMVELFSDGKITPKEAYEWQEKQIPPRVLSEYLLDRGISTLSDSYRMEDDPDNIQCHFIMEDSKVSI